MFPLLFLLNEISAFPLIVILLITGRRRTIILEVISLLLFGVSWGLRLIVVGEETMFFTPIYTVALIFVSNILSMYVIVKSDKRNKNIR